MSQAVRRKRSRQQRPFYSNSAQAKTGGDHICPVTHAAGSAVQESTDDRPPSWRGVMKALITALALVTLISDPTFARPAAHVCSVSRPVRQLCRLAKGLCCRGGVSPLWQG